MLNSFSISILVLFRAVSNVLAQMPLLGGLEFQFLYLSESKTIMERQLKPVVPPSPHTFCRTRAGQWPCGGAKASGGSS